jgi:hypothetical protein
VLNAWGLFELLARSRPHASGRPSEGVYLKIGEGILLIFVGREDESDQWVGEA